MATARQKVRVGHKKTMGYVNNKAKSVEELKWVTNLEREAILLLAFYSSVLTISTQSTHFKYKDDNGQIRNAYPDVFTETLFGNVIWEVKPEFVLNDKALLQKLKKTSSSVHRSGLQYFVLRESTIKQQPRLRNIQLLSHYRSFRLSSEHVAVLMSASQIKKYWLLEELSQQFQHDGIAVIYSLIMHGQVMLDLQQAIKLSSRLTIVTDSIELPNHTELFVNDPLRGVI